MLYNVVCAYHSHSHSQEIKRLKRKLDEPLHFGDDITFYAENYDLKTGYIKKFERGMKNCPRFPRRSGDQVGLLLGFCMPTGYGST